MFGRSRTKHQAASIYTKVVDQARDKYFYTALCVPDTVEGRFELVVLHAYLMMRRLKAIGRATETLCQELFEYMFDDLDRSIREIGVGDMSVGKYMKRLGKAFYGRAAAYDSALNDNDQDALTKAVKRNILETSEADTQAIDQAAHRLALYIDKSDRELAHYDLNRIVDLQFTFASLFDVAA